MIHKDKEIGEDWEKEAMRRYLLASTIRPPTGGGIKGSGRLAGYWQRLFKRSWVQ
jgi:hypothetical protein